MDKNTVTRTFSIGAISSGTQASGDFYAARRHSSAGIRGLLWATSRAKSLKCSSGSDSQTSWENLFPNILTPDSIPPFTIPRLSVQNSLRLLDKETEEGYTESEPGGSLWTQTDASLCAPPACSTLSLSSSGFCLALSDRRAARSVSDPTKQRRSLLQREMSYPTSFTEDQHCLDPASKAALSLPHLTKVTTPYGFVTLSQSPQMASEEALLCQAGLWRLNKDRGLSQQNSFDEETVESKGNSSHMSRDKTILSKDSPDSQNNESVKEETSDSSASSNTLVSSTPRNPDGRRRRCFYKIMKKHFTSFGMKSCD